MVTIEANNILGKKVIPPSLGVAFLWIFRSLGISYRHLRLQKSRIRGVYATPHIILNRKALSRYIIINNSSLFFIIITNYLCYYCMLSQFYFLQSQYSEQPFFANIISNIQYIAGNCV